MPSTAILNEIADKPYTCILHNFVFIRQCKNELNLWIDFFCKTSDVYSFKPVSYTHLDVYKRQEEEEEEEEKKKKKKKWNTVAFLSI